MKTKVINMIKILGIGLTELIMDITLSEATFNSIEWCEEDDIIWLHIFREDDDIQVSFDYEDLPEDDQLHIFMLLSSILYN
jgi:hypothetical protein